MEIIIVNWNGRVHTLQCLAAVEAQAAAVPRTTITVVDNGSADGSPTAIASAHPQVKLFALRENRGFTGGIAAALRGSSAEFVVLLNNDAVPGEGWLHALVRSLREAPADVVAVGGKIVDMADASIDFIGGVITFDGHALQSGFRFPLGSQAEPRSGDEILFACGGNMIARRREFEELGGFDNDYFAYLEDVDFGWRSWLSGFRILFEPRASVRHSSSATSNRLGDFERGVLFERNALQTALKNYEESVFREACASVFYTYLHRLHHFATTRNEEAGELVRPPFQGTPAANGEGLWTRLRRRFLGPRTLARVSDPLTTMQFRALEWIFRHSDQIVEKREAVQRRRRRSDAEIFERFPLHIVPTYAGDDHLMRSSLFRLLRPSLPSVERNLRDIIRT